MASLVEELVSVLESEETLYHTMVGYGEEKREVLIRADVPALERITALEQVTSDDLMSLSNRQIRILNDIAIVLGKNQGEMTVSKLIDTLGSQPEIQQKLTGVRDRLIAVAGELQHLNDENIVLLRQAIELNEFDLTLFKSYRQAPETANYDKNACSTGSRLGGSGFDISS
ncbi:MAG: flagellar protein FlgN [Agathobacter sp.]|nr:flagellar protein FlgN [Agathobacter sp.]